ncbi:MAG: alpha-L-fucosidase [Ilumatobacteraceae bacterium]
MGTPLWWQQRRFGLLVQASIATVPAWAPIGEYAGWYRAHIDPSVSDVLLHPSPLVESLAHHRDRWSHIEQYEEFLPFLTFDHYDPDAWADLARDAGMGYAVMVAKHYDGLCWWDAPGTDHTVIDQGPRRNVLGEFAAACERADLVFGTSYSLLDWHDPQYPGCDYVESVVHPQVLDLMRRYGSRMLWGDGHWGGGGDHWRSTELVRAARSIDPDVVINDRWWADRPDVRSYEYRVPNGIVDEPWELRRGLGGGLGLNRAESDDHLLDPVDIVALLTEVIAKGGHLLLCVGPDATGAIPEAYQSRLRTVGGWVRRHADLVGTGTPWVTWGDDACRYIVVDGVLHAIDVTGRGTFRAIDQSIGTVTSVTAVDGTPMPFTQTATGTQLDRQPRHQKRLPVVYRIDHTAPPEPAVPLFPDEPRASIDLVAVVGDAVRGSIVQLGEGRYVGPAHVPDGVTVRGLGSGRTTIDAPDGSAIVLGAGARVEHCRIASGAERIVWLPKVVVTIEGSGSSLLGCDIDGHIEIDGHDAKVTSCRAIGLIARDVDGVAVHRSTFIGMQWDCAVDITGGSSHSVHGCEFRDVLKAVRLASTIGAEVQGNQITARWWGVHMIDTEGSVVRGNQMMNVMRAIDVEGGTLAEITGNAVVDGDSGCVIQRGASDIEVIGNHWERCRVGLLAWDAGQIHHRENAAVDLSDDALVVGP